MRERSGAAEFYGASLGGIVYVVTMCDLDESAAVAAAAQTLHKDQKLAVNVQVVAMYFVFLAESIEGLETQDLALKSLDVVNSTCEELAQTRARN